MSTTAAPAKTSYEQLVAMIQDASLLGSTAEILSWDQETMMPPGGVEYRSRQLAQLARLAHEHATHPRIGELIGEAELEHPDPKSAEAANVRDIKRDFECATKLPADLVEAFAKLASVAQH